MLTIIKHADLIELAEKKTNMLTVSSCYLNRYSTMSRATLKINYWPFLHSYGQPIGFSYALSLAIIHVASLAYPIGLSSGPSAAIDKVSSHPNMKLFVYVTVQNILYIE